MRPAAAPGQAALRHVAGGGPAREKRQSLAADGRVKMTIPFVGQESLIYRNSRRRVSCRFRGSSRAARLVSPTTWRMKEPVKRASRRFIRSPLLSARAGAPRCARVAEIAGLDAGRAPVKATHRAARIRGPARGNRLPPPPRCACRSGQAGRRRGAAPHPRIHGFQGSAAAFPTRCDAEYGDSAFYCDHRPGALPYADGASRLRRHHRMTLSRHPEW